MTRNPYLMIPLRNIRRNSLRSFLLILGVALTVALQIGIAVSVDSMKYDFIQSQRNQNYTDITVYSEDQFTVNELKNLVTELESVNGLGKISPVSMISLLDFLPENLIDSFENTTFFYGCYSNHPDITTFKLEDGDRTLSGNNVIISDKIARLMIKEPGDTIELAEKPEFGFNGASLKVSGIITEDYPFGNELSDFIVIDFDYLHTLFDDNGLFEYHIAISVPNLLKINEISLELKDQFPNYNIVTEKLVDELRSTGIETYQTAMNLLIVASYLIEFLFITNIFVFTIKERSSEFGILRAIGTKQFQILLFILAEIFLIGIIGSLSGIFAGMGLAFILLSILKYYIGFSTLSALIVEPLTLIFSLLTGVSVTVISGIWPLIIAMRLPVVQNIHSAMRSEKKRRLPISWKTSAIIGVLLIIAGFITNAVIGEVQYSGFEFAPTQFLVIILIFFGILALEGAIIAFIPKIGVRLLSTHRLVPLLMASKDIERELQKTTITIFTAALSLSFILIVSTVSAGLLEAVPNYYGESFGENLDIVVETWDHYPYSTNFANKLKSEFYWIDHASYVQEHRSRLNIGEYIYTFGVNASSYQHFLNEFIITPENSTLPLLLEKNNNAVLSDILSDRLGISNGEKLAIILNSSVSIEIEITGIFSANPFLHDGEYIFVQTALFEQYFSKTSSKWFMIDIDGDKIPKTQAEKQLEDRYPLIKSVKSTHYYESMIENSLGVQGAFVHFIFIHTFLLSGLTQFISILISTMKMEREVAIMRALGLSKTGVFRVFLSEAGILGFTGVIFGIINSILGSELLAWYIGQVIPIQVTIEGTRDQFFFLLWIFVALLVTLGSTYIPSYRASQTNIIGAISGRHELKEAVSVIDPVEFDVKAVTKKLQATPDYVEELQSRKAVTKEADEIEIQGLLNNIASLSQNLDLSKPENQKWIEWYKTQEEKYNQGILDKTKYASGLKRYIKFLKRNNG